MRAVAGVRGGWLWAVSGVVTAAAIGVPAIVAIGKAGTPSENVSYAFPRSTITRTFTVPQRVDAVTLASYGGPVRITAGAVSRVQVTEAIAYDKAAGGPPAVIRSVSGGRLTLGDPACGQGDCAVAFTLTVPPRTTSYVSSAGGQVSVSGTAGRTTIDSGSGVVNAVQLSGPLTVSTSGGALLIDGLAGDLSADSGSGFVDAQGLTSAKVTVSTGGGPAVLGFGAPPRSVAARSDSGSIRIGVPGGPYALAADSGGGLESVEVPTDPRAGRSLTVNTGGGTLLIDPSVPGVALPVKGVFLPGPGGDGAPYAGKIAQPLPPPAPPKP